MKDNLFDSDAKGFIRREDPGFICTPLIGSDRAKDYASSLLESKKGATVFASAFGGAKMRTRIENILSFKKLTWFSLTVFIALIGTVFYVILTNAG